MSSQYDWNTRQDRLQGERVRIAYTDNEFAREHVGKRGTVRGYAPCGMVSVDLDDGTSGYWARVCNLNQITGAA